ncbi:hypothetical protein M8828_01140 [Aeromonas simiae]|uniref:hypothetical protein n=1 Tax=Aeromonas simiae TaxID=218936 RepID=UPI00266B7D70|nr:hypothetical protein [Aeromonas simiae]MDO2946979.1 hypothetical protein [Aeromonas simiae]MDO2954427.1 hypothetical protein [Aeromonas simiae]
MDNIEQEIARCCGTVADKERMQQLVKELTDQLADATRQCGVMAELLRETVRVIPAIGVAIDDLPVVDAFLERIEAALAGKLPDHIADVSNMVAPEGWQLVPVEATMAMISAATAATTGFGTRAQWDAMLAAAPKHQGGEPCDSASLSFSPA